MCQKDRKLRESHIIPAFVFRWIKETSATGYLRFLENINLRVQDGIKKELLCDECEGLLNVFETKFSNEIFYPYVNKELNQEGVAQGKIKSFQYSDWLLKFIISIQWRISVLDNTTSKNYLEYHHKDMQSFLEKWRLFLLGDNKDTGICETHLVFLQNLASADGDFPTNMNDRVVFYILRATDGTIIFTKKKLGVFSKIGPIAFYTFIKPTSLKKATDTKIHLNGIVKTGQKISNPDIVNFLFINRPNDIFNKMEFSEKQKKVIEESYKNDLEKSFNSLTMRAFESDQILKIKKSKS
ncbi:MAG: hypothetical protein K8R79_06445 [Calditrichales bacterium]|nr:hypothetical protein [Calditrichales bacterium]